MLGIIFIVAPLLIIMAVCKLIENPIVLFLILGALVIFGGIK